VSRRSVPPGLALAIAALVASCGGPPTPAGPSPAPRRLAALTAARRPVERRFEASGTVRGRNTAVLTSRIVAGLREVRVRAGDRVAAGQLLAVLEDADAQAAVRRARADLAAAVEGRTESEQAARAADANARVAGTAHTRMTVLLGKGAVTQQAFEEAEARQQSASAERERAAARWRGGGARIEEARAAVAGAEAALAYTRITAPFSGRVIDRRVDPGSQAAPGTPLLVVEQEGALRVEASVDESHAGMLVLGAPAHVEVESAGREADGRVTEVVPAVDPASRAFLVKIELPASGDPARPALRPGMFARVRFPIGTEERLTVPASAIRPAGDLDRLFVIEGGRAQLRLVTLGQQQSQSVEILAGLDPGEVVVAAPPADLLDGAAVEALR
jgi:RND family efflux transporter MFP subunit